MKKPWDSAVKQGVNFEALDECQYITGLLPSVVELLIYRKNVCKATYIITLVYKIQVENAIYLDFDGFPLKFEFFRQLFFKLKGNKIVNSLQKTHGNRTYGSENIVLRRKNII